MIFLLIGLLVALGFASITSNLSWRAGLAPSFLLLTKESHKDRKTRLRSIQRNKLALALSIAFNIVVGVVSNFVFAWLTTK
jgi:hypothetical protein